MDRIENIIKHIPLFRHCTGPELSVLKGLARDTRIKAGQKLELQKINAFNVVVEGAFEIETLGKNDIVYLAPGSFFGDIPFAVNRHHGSVRALIDSQLLLFDVEDLYRFFLGSFKAARGYLRSIKKMGFVYSDAGTRYAGTPSSVIAVSSSRAETGKTLFSCFISGLCAGKGKTIILDLSYKGDSVFNLYEKKVTIAMSQRGADSASAVEYIQDGIEQVSDSLSLLNITHGSRVKLDPGILSPIIFALSGEYRYIVLDLSEQDDAMREAALSLSDHIFFLLGKQKERENLYEMCDRTIREGQRVYYVVNRYFDRETSAVEGGLLLEKLDLEGEGPRSERIRNQALDEHGSDVRNILFGTKRCLVCDAGPLDAVALGGMLCAFDSAGPGFTMYYSSSMAYLVTALFVVAGNADDYKKMLVELFSPEKLNAMLDITFPDEYVIKNDGVMKTVKEMVRGRRIEFYRNAPAAMLFSEDDARARAFTTGFMKDVMTASFLLHPVFESAALAGSRYHSGYPLSYAVPEDLFRTDNEEIVYALVRCEGNAGYRSGRVLGFYERYREYAQNVSTARMTVLADRKVVLDIPDKGVATKKMLDLSEEKAVKMIKSGGLGQSIKKEDSRV
jgi:hypothetical protein